jgi:hypothetical protein
MLSSGLTQLRFMETTFTSVHDFAKERGIWPDRMTSLMDILESVQPMQDQPEGLNMAYIYRGTRTGRMSADRPNLTALPHRVSRMATVDFAEIEQRVLSALALPSELVEQFTPSTPATARLLERYTVQFRNDYYSTLKISPA